MRPETLEFPELKSFIRLLTSDEFRAELDRLGGYTTLNTGEIRQVFTD